MNITEFENQIGQAKEEYFQYLKSTFEFVQGSHSKNEVVEHVASLHNKGNNFFNLFERSLDEYGLPFYELNVDTKNRKIEDALGLADTIINHWKTLKSITRKFEVACPKPSVAAYASLQRFLKYFQPDKIEELKAKYMAAELPTKGFDDNTKHSGWKNTEKVIVFVFGVAFITTILVIAIFIPEPKPFQWNVFKTVLALAGAGIAAFIPGFIEVEINKFVRAGGALAVFVLLFFYNPANLVVNYKEVTKKYDLLSFRLGEDITTTDIVINQVTKGDSSDIAEIKNTAKKRLDIIQNNADQLGLKINLNNLFETTNSKHNLFPQSKYDYVIDGLTGLYSRNTVSYFRTGWYLTWIYVEGNIVTDSTTQREHPEFLKEFIQLYPKVASDLNSDLKSLGYDERVPEKFADIDEIKNKTAKAKEAVLKQLEN